MSKYHSGPCAPWCGYGCTEAMRDAAMKKARDVARALGEGWTPSVWENMGWHGVATSACGRVKVHPPDDHPGSSYLAFLGTTGPGGKWAEDGSTPQEAVRRVIAAAMADLGIIASLTTSLPAIDTPKRAAR